MQDGREPLARSGDQALRTWTRFLAPERGFAAAGVASRARRGTQHRREGAFAKIEGSGKTTKEKDDPLRWPAGARRRRTVTARRSGPPALHCAVRRDRGRAQVYSANTVSRLYPYSVGEERPREKYREIRGDKKSYGSSGPMVSAFGPLLFFFI